VSKLHYFSVNEHTKYKAIRCELDDDDKYRVKNPQLLIVRQAAAVRTTLPYHAGIFLFPATTPSQWNKSSQQQITWSSQLQSELVFPRWLYGRVNWASSV